MRALRGRGELRGEEVGVGDVLVRDADFDAADGIYCVSLAAWKTEMHQSWMRGGLPSFGQHFGHAFANAAGAALFGLSEIFKAQEPNLMERRTSDICRLTRGHLGRVDRPMRLKLD